MTSILNNTEFKAMRSRILNLQPTSERLWGKMNASQMLAHCAVPIEVAAGVAPFKDESNLVSRTLIRWWVLRAIKKGSFDKNLPTSPSFVMSDERDFEREKARLLSALDAFYEKGQANQLGKHPAFGQFTSEQWGGLQYTHLNHHLSQFSG